MNSVELPIRKFPCPGCGADLDFDPGLGRLKCPYCDRKEAIPQTAAEIQVHDYEEYFSGKRTRLSRLAAAAVELDCPDCGAGIIFEPPDSAGQCPFCAANLSIAQTRLASATLAPEGIVPFGCDRATAKKQLQRWLNQRWLTPAGFRKLVQLDNLEGIYLPYWSYNFLTTTDYTARRMLTNKSGTVQRLFNNVLVPAIQSINLTRLQALRPWRGKNANALAANPVLSNLYSFLRDLVSRPVSPEVGQTSSFLLTLSHHPLQADLCVYSSAYLAGFKAQRPQISLKAGFETAQQQVKAEIDRAVRSRLGDKEHKILQQSTAYSAITFKLVLLPVWLCTYRYQNKRYQVIINGCTQKMQGDYPISKLRRFVAGTISIILFLTLWNFLPILFFLFLAVSPLIIIILSLHQQSRAKNSHSK